MVPTTERLGHPHQRIACLHSRTFPDPLTQSLDHLSDVLLPSRNVDFCFHSLEDDHHLIRRLDCLPDLAFDLPNRGGHGRRDACAVPRLVDRARLCRLINMRHSSDTVSSNLPAMLPDASSSFWANHSRRSTFSLHTVTLHGVGFSKGGTVLPRSLVGSSL